MEEKKYLKWYNKVGYGSGDIAGNVVFAFLSSFIMIYLTNTVGLNAGVIGSLIAASKVLDGISDVVFGSMIDRTHTKMGKARPWMLGAYFGCAITLIAAFSVPTTMGKTSQYVWFFITYLLLNAGFYTLQRWEHEAVLEAVHEKTWSRNETYKQRRCIVEHPFGTVKRSLGYSFFLRKRIENVDAEASSMFIAYNLKRLFAVFSTQELIAKFR